MNLHPHESARLRDLRPGEELLVVRPVVPQPPDIDDEFEWDITTDGEIWDFACYRDHPAGIDHPGGRETHLWRAIYSPHQPGDVVEVDTSWDNGATKGLGSIRLRLARVEAKRVSNVTAAEWGLAGWLIPVRGLPETGWRHLVPTWWLQTYAPLGPEYAFDRAWCWCEWWSLAAANAAGGK